MTQQDIAIGRWWRSFLLDLLPPLTILALILFMTVPLGTPIATRAGGLWPLMGITYWTLVRPRAMGSLWVFVFGVIVDLVTFLPIGLHAFVFVLAQAILKRQRRFLVGQGFWVLWAAFVVLASVAAIILSVMAELFLHTSLSLMSLFWSVGLTSAFLPLLLLALDRVHTLMDLFDEPV